MSEPAFKVPIIGGGMGGSTALRDAQVLAERLAAASRHEKTLLQAVAEYEAAMCVYAFEAVRLSDRLLYYTTSDSAFGLAATRMFFRIVNILPPLKRRMVTRE